MGLEIRALIETAVTNGTLMGRLFHVQNFVNGQRATLAESFAAFETFEWLILRVNVSARE